MRQSESAVGERAAPERATGGAPATRREGGLKEIERLLRRPETLCCM